MLMAQSGWLLNFADFLERLGVEVNFNPFAFFVKAIDFVATVVRFDLAYFPAFGGEFALQLHLRFPFGFGNVALELPVGPGGAAGGDANKGDEQK